jgi:hypothetical protein
LKKHDLREFIDEEIAFRNYGFHLLEDKTRDRVRAIYEGKSRGVPSSAIDNENSRTNLDVNKLEKS